MALMPIEEKTGCDLPVAAGEPVGFPDVSGGTVLKIISGENYGGSGEGFSVLSGGVVYVGTSNNRGSGGTIVSGTVAERGNVYVFDSGIASATTVSGGNFYVYSGGTVLDTGVSGGNFNLYAGGSASGVTLESGGNFFIQSNAVVTGLEQRRGGRINLMVKGGAATAVTGVNEFGEFALSGGVANGFVVYSGGEMTVSAGGVVNGVIQEAGGMVNVAFSAGDATVVTGTNPHGEFYLSGGVASGFVIYSRGSQTVGRGGAAFGTVLSSAGTQEIQAQGTAYGTVIAGDRGFQRVEEGGAAYGTIVSSGGQITLNGGVVSGTGLHSGGRLLIVSGSAFDVVQQSGGMLDTITVGGAVPVEVTGYGESGRFQVSGGVGSNLVIYDGSELFVTDSGVAYDVLMRGGIVYVSSGGTASRAVIGSGGLLEMQGGVTVAAELLASGSQYVEKGIASGTVVDSGGFLRISGYGSAVEARIMSGGSVWVSPGGSALATRIESGGKAVLYNGGTAVDAEIAAGGVLDVRSGGTLTGTITFDLSGAVVSGGAMLMNYAQASGIVLTVVAKQTPDEGAYVLASAAADFAGTVAVSFLNNSFTLAAGESYADYQSGLVCGLFAEASGNLAFTVAAAAGSLTETDTCSTVTLNVSDQGAKWGDSAMRGASGLITAWQGGSSGGNLFLEIDTLENASDAVVFGGEFAGTANFKFTNGAIAALMGGADTGGALNGVNLVVGGGTSAAASLVYGAGRGSVYGDVNVEFKSGATVSTLAGGAVLLATASGGLEVAGDIRVAVSGGTVTGNVIGGHRVNVGDATGTASVAGSITVEVTGGLLKAGQSVYGGGFAVGNGSAQGHNAIEVLGGVNIVWDGGAIDSGAVAGRGLFGGAFASDSATALVQGGVNITIGSGTVGNVFGGGWAQDGGSSIVEGDVSITVTGGSVTSIFGGGAHAKEHASATSVVNGDVNITVSGGTIGRIYARGQVDGDSLNGNATVTFTGAADFSTRVSGIGYNRANSTEEGVSLLVFSDYSGTFSGSIEAFDSVTVSGETAAVFEAVQMESTCLVFDLDGRSAASSGAAMLNWDGGELTNQTVVVAVNSLDTLSSSSWSLVELGSGDWAQSGYRLYINEVSYGELALGEAVVGGDFDGWQLYVDRGDGNTLKFGILA